MLRQRILRWLVHWAFPSLVLLGSLAYAFLHVRDTSFLSGTIGNLLATLVGVLVGVPIALEIESARTSQESIAAESRDRAAERDTLEVLLGEILGNLERLRLRSELMGTVPVDPLMDSRWRAITAAGMLRYIRSPQILAALSDAYRLTELIDDLEKRVHGAVWGINVQYPDGETAATKILATVAQFHAPAENVIGQAATLVQARVLELGSNLPARSA